MRNFFGWFANSGAVGLLFEFAAERGTAPERVRRRLVHEFRWDGIMKAESIELITKSGWAYGFLIAFLQLSVFVMAGYLWLTVRAFRRGDTAVGILFAALWLLIGGGWLAGVLLGLVFGWVWVRRWNALPFMIVWSILVVLAIGNFALAGVMMKMSLDDWRAYFGWLPAL
ncbi:unnamed protein product [Gemmata massiliana]|uniref:Uncharacterized protein n=1 Tax=Gemmata massiliana TaxID=1210884 RepID=A0A6P2D6Z9_9BACT|nr:hypothetical protein [Gemmata massiliana]VTR96697.1 unnamed protein product [Gemmata massiliana]